MRRWRAISAHIMNKFLSWRMCASMRVTLLICAAMRSHVWAFAVWKHNNVFWEHTCPYESDKDACNTQMYAFYALGFVFIHTNTDNTRHTDTHTHTHTHTQMVSLTCTSSRGNPCTFKYSEANVALKNQKVQPCVCVCVCLFVCMCMLCMYVCVHVCMHVLMLHCRTRHACSWVCVCLCVYLCMHMYLRVYVNVCTCICTYSTEESYRDKWVCVGMFSEAYTWVCTFVAIWLKIRRHDVNICLFMYG